MNSASGDPGTAGASGTDCDTAGWSAGAQPISPLGSDVGNYADAPPPPPSDFMQLVNAAPGETATATTVMGAGTHLIDATTMTANSTDHLWRVALINVIQP